MAWYAASVIMYVRYKDGIQDKYPVWENVLLINSASIDEALQKAERIGKDREGDSDGSLTWGGRPAEWIYAGIRKLMTVSNPNDVNNVPDDGAEITYSEFEVANQESLRKLVEGQEVAIQYIE
jgi:hypothetical protein